MHLKDQQIVNELRERLSRDHRDWLWSNKTIKKEDISDKLIVEKFLAMGKKSDWDLLKKAFKHEFIRKVWLQNGGAYSPMNQNHKIASYIFHIKDPEAYQDRKMRQKLADFSKGY